MCIQRPPEIMAGLLLTAFACLLTGCNTTTEPTGPELGALESYLDENPEQRIDNDQDADAEEDFGDGEP
mgnify:FL=1|jgi:hypothetical protein